MEENGWRDPAVGIGGAAVVRWCVWFADTDGSAVMLHGWSFMVSYHIYLLHDRCGTSFHIHFICFYPFLFHIRAKCEIGHLQNVKLSTCKT